MIVESDGSDFRLGEFKADRGALLRLALRRGWDGGWACNDEIVHQLFKQCRFTRSLLKKAQIPVYNQKPAFRSNGPDLRQDE